MLVQLHVWSLYLLQESGSAVSWDPIHLWAQMGALAKAVVVHKGLLEDPDSKVRLGAVKLLYEAQGLLVQKQELSGPGGATLRIVVEDGSGTD